MKKRYTIIAAILGLTFIGAKTDDGCGSASAERADARAVNEQQELYQKTQPLPKFDYSLERDAATQLYQARNQKVTTWTVWRSDMGTIEGDCPSVGYPIPYDTSLTNPLKHMYRSSGGAVVEQAEPNGLFSSKNSVATWVRCLYTVNGEDVEAPVYVESKVTAFPFPLVVNYETGRVQPVADAEPSVTIKAKADK